MSEGKERMILKLANHVNYDNVSAAATTTLANAKTIADGNVTLDGTQPDVPRNCVLTISAATVVGGTATVYGIDQNGEMQKEVHTLIASAQTYTGNVAFAKILQVTVADLDAAGTETISVGFADKLGLPIGPHGKLCEVFLACAAGASEAIGTVNKTYGTIDPTTAADNSADFDFWYSYEVPLL